MKKKFLTILLSVFLLTGWTASLRAELKKELYSPEEWERMKKSGIVSEEKPEVKEEVVRTNNIHKYDFSMQEAMADEALKHIGEHYLKNTSGGKGCTTPKVWNGVVCTTWKKFHKTEQISCIGVRHFDCSGFVSFCAKAVGYDLGHLGTQYFYDKGPVVHIPLSNIRKGTLIFKGWGANQSDVSHVAIYLGNGKVIECGGISARVQITLWKAWLDGARKGENHLLAGNLLCPESRESKH